MITESGSLSLSTPRCHIVTIAVLVSRLKVHTESAGAMVSLGALLGWRRLCCAPLNVAESGLTLRRFSV